MAFVIGIAASPRRGGLTETLLDKSLEACAASGARTRKAVLNELAIRPCQACGGCLETGRCVIRDDMDGLYRDILDADGIIVASPVYFGSVTAQLKAMVDRFQCEWVNRFQLKASGPRRASGVFLCVSDTSGEVHFECAKRVVGSFFKTVGAGYSGDLFVAGAALTPDALAKAAALGAVAARGLLP